MFSFLKAGVGKVGKAGKAFVKMEVGFAKKLVRTFGSGNLILAILKRIKADSDRWARPLLIAFGKTQIAKKPEFDEVMRKYKLTDEDVAKKYRVFVNLAFTYFIVMIVFFGMAIIFGLIGNSIGLVMALGTIGLPAVLFFKYSLAAGQVRQRNMLTAKEFLNQARWWSEAFK